VTQFESAFHTVALDAHPIEQIDLLYWFRQGLLPEIREGCTKPSSGQREFGSLAELVTHALLQEEFLKETNPSASKMPRIAALQAANTHKPPRVPRFKQTDSKGKRALTSEMEWTPAASAKKPRVNQVDAADRDMEEIREWCWKTGRCTNCMRKSCSIKTCTLPRTDLGKYMDTRWQKRQNQHRG
jgi:hypothetical protein